MNYSVNFFIWWCGKFIAINLVNWKVTSVLEYMIDRDPCIVGRIGAGPQRYELYPTTPPPSSQPSQACEVRVLLSSLPHVLYRTCQPTTRRELCIWVSIIWVLLAFLVCFLLGLFFLFLSKANPSWVFLWSSRFQNCGFWVHW